MIFQFNINLNEEDYLAFNIFHAFESAHGKGMIRKSCIFITLLVVILAAITVIYAGWTESTIIYVAMLGLLDVFYVVLFKKILIKSIKMNIKRLKKIGKLPFDPLSTIEFYEDKIVEITASKRSEQKYDVLERICVVKDRYVYVYSSSIGAYILPMAQIKAQSNQGELLNFLSQKCSTIEFY